MHMADALLSPAVGLTMTAVSVAVIGISVIKVKKDDIGEKKAPIMGVAGAMVFAAQMINFAIPATGSSGHIGGGILLAGLLGGIPAFLSITAVLIIQCLFFADGGLLALGANIFNLGVAPCIVIYPLLFKPLLKGGADYKRLTIASIVSAVIGLELGAFLVVVQTLLSGITQLPFGTFVAFMMPIHLVIGLIEGIITAAILCFVYKMRPEIIELSQSGKSLGGVSTKKAVVTFIVLIIVIVGALLPFASGNPDGLEWAIDKTTEKTLGVQAELNAESGVHNSAERIQESTAFLPDYGFAVDTGNTTGTTVSGIAGAVITFAIAGSVGLIISVIKKSKRVKANA